MEKTFKDFMARRYAEAAEYASGVTRGQIDIAEEAWELATLAEREECAKACEKYGASLNNEWNQSLGVAGDLVETCEECAEAIRARSNATLTRRP